MEKSIYFIAGLPKSGSTLITNILKQNPEIYGNEVSSLASIFENINSSWKEHNNIDAKVGVLKSILQGYYSNIDKSIIVDENLKWIPLIPQVEDVLNHKVKIIVCVRNPAEILTSFERFRKENPLLLTEADLTLKESSNIVSRAYYYSSPEGLLGLAHQNLKDAITMGYLDRFLFIDYNRFCNSPKSQTKRIYEFLELSHFDHNFEHIDREVISCVQYLGLDLYEQYNREIFWTAWI